MRLVIWCLIALILAVFLGGGGALMIWNPQPEMTHTEEVIPNAAQQ